MKQQQQQQNAGNRLFYSRFDHFTLDESEDRQLNIEDANQPSQSPSP